MNSPTTHANLRKVAQLGLSSSNQHILHVGMRPRNDQDNHWREKLCHLIKDVGCFHEICPEKLYLVYLSKEEQDAQSFCDYNSTDPRSPFIFCGLHNLHLLSYEPFNMDFGPFNLAATHQFCTRIKVYLDTLPFRNPDKCVVLVLDDRDVNTKLNATLLVAIAGMVLLNLTDQEIILRLGFYMIHKDRVNGTSKELIFREKRKFTDVSGNPSLMSLTLEDCIRSFYAAIQHKFYDYYEFDPVEYLFYETVMSGDLNWIVPGKILAFAGPSDHQVFSKLYHKHPPKFYYHYFKDHNVTTIIRLNEPEYESAGFEELGFDHHDLIFPDGYPPTSPIAAQFIKIVDEAKGAVAVHCYAGIGRTGTLIAAYLMARYDFSPQMAVAWTRICRPGSVIGEQQDWLFTKFDQCSINKSSSKPPKSRKNKSNTPADPVKDEPQAQGVKGKKSELSAKTTYAIAEKTYGQAKALVLAKKQRDTFDRPCTRNSGLLKTTTTTNATAATQAEAAQKSRTEETDVVLNLGKSVPIMLSLVDLKDLKNRENPKLYRIKDGKYEWTARFPPAGYVTLRHDIDVQAFLNTCVKSKRAFWEPILDFRYEHEEAPENNKELNNGVESIPRLKPIAFYSLTW